MALLYGIHAQVCPRLILPCFSDVLGRATVATAQQEKVLRCRALGLIFLCRVKVHTVKGVSMAKLEGPS